MNIADKLTHEMFAWRRMTKVNIDNVVDYLLPEYFNTPISAEKEFPNSAPPWDDALSFWKFPADAGSYAGIEALAYVHAHKLDPEIENYEPLSDAKPWYSGGPGDIPERGWYMEMEFYDNDRRIGGLPMRIRWYMDEMGAVKRREFYLVENSPTRVKEQRWLAEEVEFYSILVMFAINLMHCKNTSLEERRPEPKLAAKQLKKRGIPKVTYHVLTVQPMRINRKGQATVENTGVHQPLHICRGHFKDYRNGKGLFGKLKGIYWWDSYARGDMDEGTAVKDYKVGVIRNGRPDKSRMH